MNVDTTITALALILPLAIGLNTFGVVRPMLVDRTARWSAVFARVADALGGGSASSLGVTAEVNGRQVRLDSAGAQLTISVSGLPPTLEVTRRAHRPNAIPTGDRAFDDAVFVDGPPLPTAAVLDAATRARLLRAVTEGAFAEKGSWHLTLDAPTPKPENEGRYAATLVAHARGLLELAELWTLRVTPYVALSAMVRDEQDAAVRAMALLRLAVVLKPGPLLALCRERLGTGLASSQPDERVAAVILACHGGDASELGPLQALWTALSPGPERDGVAWAMEGIRGRLGPGSVGALSLASADGDLSVAADGGELSLGRAG